MFILFLTISEKQNEVSVRGFNQENVGSGSDPLVSLRAHTPSFRDRRVGCAPLSKALLY